jgi:hypothetical protein
MVRTFATTTLALLMKMVMMMKLITGNTVSQWGFQDPTLMVQLSGGYITMMINLNNVDDDDDDHDHVNDYDDDDDNGTAYGCPLLLRIKAHI